LFVGSTSLKLKVRSGILGVWKEEHPKSPDPGTTSTPQKYTNSLTTT